MDQPQQLVLIGYLTDELGALFDQALLVEPPAGVNDAWAATLAKYHVAPVGGPERAAMQARLQLSRGALPVEVAACARAIAKRFAEAVGDARLVEAATEVWAQTEATYLKHATWRPKSMFAFAVQSATTAKSKGWQRPPGGYVLRCTQCGGPRLEEDLGCKFCGKENLIR